MKGDTRSLDYSSHVVWGLGSRDPLRVVCDLILKYFHFIPKLKIFVVLCDETTKTLCGFMCMFYMSMFIC